MTTLWFAGVSVRASILLLSTLAAAFALRRSSASLRRALLGLGLVACLLLPLIQLSFPGRPVMHVANAPLAGRVLAEALSPTVVVGQTKAVRAPTAAASPTLFTAPASLTVLWSLGAGITLLRVGLGRMQARRLRRSARPLDAELMARVRAEIDADARIRVLTTDAIDAPVVMGLLKPLILLPRAAAKWSRPCLRTVLIHELAHVQSRDALVLFGAEVACAAYWFHPLAWMVRRSLRRECELAADEAVVQAGVKPSLYAEHLLAIARELLSPPFDGVIAMASRPSELGRRIGVLVGRERLPTRLTTRRALALVAVALMVLAVVACTEAGTREPKSVGERLLPATPAGDARLQRIVQEEVQVARNEWQAQRIAVVVLDPHSGAVLADFDDTPGAPIVPASTLKPLTVALALDGDLITPEQRFDCGNGTRAYDSLTLRDAGAYGSLNSAEILAVSSNIGVSRIFDVLGGDRLGDGLRRFHVTPPAAIPSGTLRGAIIAIGEGSTATPLTMAAAYSVFANDGVFVAPGVPAERVIKSRTARTLRVMLEGVVNGARATGKAANIPGVRVGGKTGTSDDEDCESCAPTHGLFASFVGLVPIDSPRWVIYVGVGQPKQPGSGGTIAAPVFARIASRALGS